MKLLLTHPDMFFKMIIKNNTNLKIPLVILLIIGILNSFSIILLSKNMINSVPADMQTFFFYGLVLNLIFIIIAPLAFWPITTFSVHLISILFNGSGNYRKTLEGIGYSQSPQIISAGFTLVLFTLNLDLINSLKLFNSQSLYHYFELSTFKISAIVNRFGLFWTLFLSAIAVREVHKISNKKAAASVLIPVILYVGITELVKRWFASGL